MRRNRRNNKGEKERQFWIKGDRSSGALADSEEACAVCDQSAISQSPVGQRTTDHRYFRCLGSMRVLVEHMLRVNLGALVTNTYLHTASLCSSSPSFSSYSRFCSAPCPLLLLLLLILLHDRQLAQRNKTWPLLCVFNSLFVFFLHSPFAHHLSPCHVFLAEFVTFLIVHMLLLLLFYASFLHTLLLYCLRGSSMCVP